MNCQGIARDQQLQDLIGLSLLAVVLDSDPPTQLQYLREAVHKNQVGSLGDRGFRSARPAAWNSLPDELHRITDTDLFKRRRLKTVLFSRTHCH